MGNARVLHHVPQVSSPARRRRAPDRAGMRRAVAAFLRAARLDPEEPNLKDTPRRVADAWADEFLAGYRGSAASALAEVFPIVATGERELVVVTNLHYRSMCPHHLMPYSGTAHVAYLPGAAVVGFGRLPLLIETLAHRLVLQEELARQIACALVEHLGSQGAACLLTAEQTCLRLRGSEQHEAVTHAEAYEGVLREPALRAELWARLGAKR
jgi:GTP cyclohydrolase I